MVRYSLLILINKVMLLLFTRFSRETNPISWHRELIPHYLILLPINVSLIAEKDVIRQILRSKFPYFRMQKTHEDIFMDELYTTIVRSRKDTYFKMYKINTDLDDDAIDKRLDTISLIYNNYVNVEMMHHLGEFLVQDHSLPVECVEDLRENILNALVISISVDWGHGTRC